MGGVLVGIVYLAIIVLLLAGMWKTFEKAGKPGWAAIVPIYNIVVLLEIVRKPIWWIILMLIPIANIIVAIIIYIELARVFGRGAGFGLGLVFLSFIFFPILGFGDDQYIYGNKGMSNADVLDSEL